MERSGWRDLELSQRHRLWGRGCHMVDLDFVGLENDFGEPSALVEYKAFGLNGSRPNLDADINLRALRSLADGVQIPFLVAHYRSNPWLFRVFRGNDYAAELYPEDGYFTERAFVQSLYSQRGRPVDRSVLDGLDDEPLRRRAA